MVYVDECHLQVCARFSRSSNYLDPQELRNVAGSTLPDPYSVCIYIASELGSRSGVATFPGELNMNGNQYHPLSSQ